MTRLMRWWDRGAVESLTGELVPEDPAKDICRISEAIWEQQGAERLEMAEAALCLYFGNNRHSLSGISSAAVWPVVEQDPATFNVVQACTDTKTSHIARNKVRPMFLTEAGNSELREKAEGMQLAVEGIFGETGIYGDAGMAVCRDGNLFDGGAVKWTIDFANNRVLGERIFVHDLLVPEREARFGKPRQMGHRMAIDRDVLLDFFKDDEGAVKAIREAPPISSEHGSSVDVADPGQVTDQIRVYEWWHLPSGRVDLSEDAAFGINEDGDFDASVDCGHDGRRVIVIEGKTLLDEPWPYEYFPVALFLPMKNPDGMWSRGIPETLASTQLAINKWNRRIDAILHFHAVPRLIAWRQAKINKAKITNGLSDVLESDVPPQQAIHVLNPQSVPGELVERIDRLIAWAEKQVGLSEMSIAAQKPKGVDHAPGMQHLADTESVRHTTAFRAWEQFHLDSARIVVDCLRMLARRKPDYEVVFGESKELRRIAWKRVDLGAERYHLKVWPTNLLPQTPAAKASRVIEFLRDGLFTRSEALAMLDYPDIEAITGNAAAELTNIERKLDAAARGDDDAGTVHGYLNLGLAKVIAKQRINQMEAAGEDWEKIDRVIQFWEDCDELEKRAANDTALAQQGALPPPGGPAAPPPAPLPGGAPPPALPEVQAA